MQVDLSEVSSHCVSYFLGRERLLPAPELGGMPGWRTRIFSFLSRNSEGPSAFYHIPPDQVIEVGVQVSI